TEQLPAAVLHDDAGAVRVVRRVATYADVLDASFNQIRQAGAAKPSVLIHLLHAIAAIAGHGQTHEHRCGLTRHAGLVRSTGHRDITEAADRDDLERAFERAMRALR
ncbi:MAG TPA: DUF2254 family protein, partial [Rubrivivax sp.]|nr:DUF2254 family protein [Rubrivivax sp.]